MTKKVSHDLIVGVHRASSLVGMSHHGKEASVHNVVYQRHNQQGLRRIHVHHVADDAQTSKPSAVQMEGF